MRSVRASATGGKLNVLICLIQKRSPVLTYHNFVLRNLCCYYAPFRLHRYFVLSGYGKLDFRFVHSRDEKCVGNGAHIIGRNRRGK